MARYSHELELKNFSYVRNTVLAPDAEILPVLSSSDTFLTMSSTFANPWHVRGHLNFTSTRLVSQNAWTAKNWRSWCTTVTIHLDDSYIDHLCSRPSPSRPCLKSNSLDTGRTVIIHLYRTQCTALIKGLL